MVEYPFLFFFLFKNKYIYQVGAQKQNSYPSFYGERRTDLITQTSFCVVDGKRECKT